MDNLKEKVQDLAKMIEEHKLMEAFEKYYADDVSMQENENAPMSGKAANREREMAFVGGITEWHDVKILGIAVGEDYSTLEVFMDVTHKDWGRSGRAQVAVQHWKDGKIVKEKFYYNAA